MSVPRNVIVVLTLALLQFLGCGHRVYKLGFFNPFSIMHLLELNDVNFSMECNVYLTEII